jgi:hypothetical protein
MFETAEKVFDRRDHRVFGETEQNLLLKIFELTEEYRRF